MSLLLCKTSIYLVADILSRLETYLSFLIDNEEFVVDSRNGKGETDGNGVQWIKPSLISRCSLCGLGFLFLSRSGMKILCTRSNLNVSSGSLEGCRRDRRDPVDNSKVEPDVR